MVTISLGGREVRKHGLCTEYSACPIASGQGLSAIITAVVKVAVIIRGAEITQNQIAHKLYTVLWVKLGRKVTEIKFWGPQKSVWGPQKVFGDHFCMVLIFWACECNSRAGTSSPCPARLPAPDEQCTSYSVVVTISLLFSS